ncbi:MAG: IS110 family transposase [Pseudomonadota bacterium]|nr:IS110 family transposase [Pseudomonadota bacterium]
MQTMLNFGADVDSRYSVIACAESTWAPQRIAHERRAIQAWLRSVPPGSRLGLEATGGYQELLADLAHAAGLIVFVLNARDVRHYAQGLGRRGKTDRVDAEVIARYIAHEHAELHAYRPLTKEQRALERLLKRRAKLVAIKGALQQSLRGLPGVCQELTQVIARLDRLIVKLEALMQAALQTLPAAQRTAHQVATIPGFGTLAGTSLGHTFTRIPFAHVNAVIAHTGLDPRPHDSGQKHGRRRLSKRGPSEQRRMLFNCAMSAAKTKLWRPYYLAQRAKGLSSTAAIVILARKMVRVAFALYKHDQNFDPARLVIIA